VISGGEHRHHRVIGGGEHRHHRVITAILIAADPPVPEARILLCA